MAAITPPPLSLRDFIQHIFPTVIGACLFIPFYQPLYQVLTIEGLIVASIIFGYLISSPMNSVASFITNHLPILRRKLEEYAKEASWHKNNWDYDKLFYSLSKDDKEYIYLTGSYAEFYRLVGFYLLVYWLLNGLLVINALMGISSLTEVRSVITDLKTPMMGHWHANTIILFIVSFVLVVFSFRDFLIEFKALFLSDGQYVTMAQNYHREKGNIAKSIWGKVLKNGEGVRCVTVKLFKENGDFIAETKTDANGNFQSVGKYTECLNTTCRITITTAAGHRDRLASITNKQIPYFEIEAP